MLRCPNRYDSDDSADLRLCTQLKKYLRPISLLSAVEQTHSKSLMTFSDPLDETISSCNAFETIFELVHVPSH